MRDKFDKVVFVETMPEKIDDGVLYVSLKYGGLLHLCPCGCGQRIYIPINKDLGQSWSLQQESDGTISLAPSLQNTCACWSHYFIRHNKVAWCGKPRSVKS